MTDHALIDRFRQARRDTSLAVMDGLHAVKHGLRFGAETLEMVSPDVDAVLRLATEVAPDITPPAGSRVNTSLGRRLPAALARAAR